MIPAHASLPVEDLVITDPLHDGLLAGFGSISFGEDDEPVPSDRNACFTCGKTVVPYQPRPVFAYYRCPDCGGHDAFPAEPSVVDGFDESHDVERHEEEQ